MRSLLPCVGCGALVPDIDGPTHRYIGASPGCWAAYGELQARGYGTPEAPAFGAQTRLCVDAYASQHPGVPGKQSSQSVCVHLFALCMVLERGLPPACITPTLVSLLEKYKSRGFLWLDPPPSLGSVTVLDVMQARSGEEHDRRVRQWAEAVWEAWEPHHARVRRWADDWTNET